MSVIQSIRDKGAWIIFSIIAIALLAFILQDASFSRGNLFTNTTVMGKINGEKISRTEFENKLAFIEQTYGAQAGNREQLISGLWEQEVERIINNQEYTKLGLTVSAKELTDLLFNEQTSPLKREFTDPATGVFNVDQAKQAFAQIKKSKNAEQLKMINEVYINPTIEQALRNKYNALLANAAYAPKWLAEKTLADNNSISSISFVAVPYTSIVDSTIKVSDDEIIAYAQKNKALYEKDYESRQINYVQFSASPSGADSAATKAQVEALKADFTNTNDAQAYLAKVGTELPYYDGYFSKTRMQQAVKDSIVRLSVGQVFGPYLDAKNYVYAKMIDIKNMPDSATVRHILIGTANQQGQQLRADSVAKKLADSIQTAISGGANFEVLALQYSDDPGSKMKGGVYDYFPQGQMVPAFNDFSFSKPVGSKGVVKTDFGYHYIEVLGQKSVQPAYKVAYLAKPIIASQETVSAASTAAAQFAAASKNKKAFDENALKDKLTVMPSGEIKENDFTVPGIGSARNLVRWVYENSVGDVSEYFEVGEAYIVANITSIAKKGLPNASALRIQVEPLVRNQKKAAQIIDTKFKSNDLNAIAKEAAVTVATADSVSFANPFIPGLGMENKVVGVAFNKNYQNKASEPIVGMAGVYAVKVNTISAKGTTADVEATKQQLKQGQQQGVYRGSGALRKAASIKDNRRDFY
jgi:peptidyl-prolyl cis-trans isomerase D